MPSCRYARVVSPIGWVGKSAKQIEMSIAVMTSSTALTKFFESNVPSFLRNFMRFSDARLHELLSRLMYSEHGLDALMRPVAGVVCLWWVVSSGRVGARRCGRGDLAEQRLGVDGLEHPAVHAGTEAELGALLDRAHELVGDADGVVGVLVLDAGDVLAAEVHVVAGVAQRADLVLLARLGLDELLDVGVVDVEDDHLGRAAGGPTGLDRAGRRVGAAHEADGARGGATGGEQLLGGADTGQVEAGAGAAL